MSLVVIIASGGAMPLPAGPITYEVVHNSDNIIHNTDNVVHTINS